MSERYEITDDGHLTIAIKLGANTLYADELDDEFVVGAIRQQARDIDQAQAEIARLHSGAVDMLNWKDRTIAEYKAERDKLRADLAAAVAERSEYWGALHSTKDELFECRANQRTLESDLRITRDQRDTLRARLAAIDNAQTVAIAVHVYTDRGPYKYLNFAEHDIPASGVELIARPAKECIDRALEGDAARAGNGGEV